MYFKLFANCIPVKGINQSLIYDLQRIDVYNISNEIYDNLGVIENTEIGLIKSNNEGLYSFLCKLVNEEIGFFTESPENFPPLNLNFETPNIIDNAIIEIGKNSKHNYDKLFNELKSVFCRKMLLMFNHKPLYSKVDEIIRIAKSYDILYIELWFQEEVKLKKILKENSNIRKVVFINSKRETKKNIEACEVVYSTFESFSQLCSMHSQKFILNQAFFSESLKFNTCLNKKVAIDKDLQIKNCVFLPNSYGGYINNDMKTVVTSSEFQQIWHLSKDNIETCKDCQNRYMCKDCRAFVTDSNDKPINCNYNPYHD